MNQWRETVTNLATLGFQLPMDLAGLDFAAIMQLTWGSNLGKEAKMLWQKSCVLAFQEPNTRAAVQFTRASDEAGKLLELVKGDDFQNTRLIRTHAGDTGRLKLANDFPRLGHAAKLRALNQQTCPETKCSAILKQERGPICLSVPACHIGISLLGFSVISHFAN